MIALLLIAALWTLAVVTIAAGFVALVSYAGYASVQFPAKHRASDSGAQGVQGLICSRRTTFTSDASTHLE